LRYSNLPPQAPFGATTIFSLNYDAYEWDVVGPITIRMRSGGETFYEDTVDDELTERYLRLDLGDAPATVTATFVQEPATDASSQPCTQTISALVRGYRHFGAIDRCDEPTYRPRSIVIACGDGNFGLESLRWRGWNRAVADAWGTAYANDCVPYCAAGRFCRYAVDVRAFRVRRMGDGYAYTRLRVAYRNVRLAGAARQVLRAVTDGASFGWR
jgi:hypothetical protein